MPKHAQVQDFKVCVLGGGAIQATLHRNVSNDGGQTHQFQFVCMTFLTKIYYNSINKMNNI